MKTRMSRALSLNADSFSYNNLNAQNALSGKREECGGE
jgi:hypothetical protein